MTTNIKKITTLSVELDANPGSLNHVFKALKDACVYVQSSWAYETKSKAETVLCVNDTDKAIEVLKGLKKKPIERCAIYADGTDYTGVYSEVLNKIADANINLTASDVQAIHGNFVSVFFADENNTQKMLDLFELT